MINWLKKLVHRKCEERLHHHNDVNFHDMMAIRSKLNQEKFVVMAERDSFKEENILLKIELDKEKEKVKNLSAPAVTRTDSPAKTQLLAERQKKAEEILGINIAKEAMNKGLCAPVTSLIMEGEPRTVAHDVIEEIVNHYQKLDPDALMEEITNNLVQDDDKLISVVEQVTDRVPFQFNKIDIKVAEEPRNESPKRKKKKKKGK